MILQVERLTKRFGPRVVVNALSFEVEQGEVMGVVGPNGSGKTVLIRLLCGRLEPDAGAARILNLDMALNRMRAQERCGAVFARAPLYDGMTPIEHLDFLARLRGLAPDRARNAVRAVLRDVELGFEIDQRIASLRPGARRRVALAAALVHDPVLLLLDAPFDGLDDQERGGLSALIAKAAAERAVVLTVRNAQELDGLAASRVVLPGGRA